MTYTLFVDRDLGKTFWEILREAFHGTPDVTVEWHDDHFPEDATKDYQFIPVVSNRHWVIVTHDKSMPKDHLDVIQRSNARLFVMIGNAPFADQARNFAKLRVSMVRTLKKNRAPFAAKVYMPTPRDQRKKLDPKGHIKIWRTWEHR